MKELQDVTACVCDYGSFISLADKLSETFKKVYYHSPCAAEFEDVKECVKGDGLPKSERLDDYHEPEIFDDIDLFIFPDISTGGIQRDLKRRGKAVFGSMGASDLELYRTRFVKLIKELDLPVVNTVTCRGLAALAAHLKQVKRKWVKVNRFRANMETWYHLDYEHSLRKLDEMAVTFGGVKERVVFVVQDEIKGDDVVEIGYDGWCIDGEYPPCSFQGYEKKNQLYLGSLLEYDELPEGVRLINETMAPTLFNYGYRNFLATEIRVKDGVPNYIDPTHRMPGQTGEHLLETCTNLPEIIWKGAHGELVKPQFSHKFAAEATVHYTAGSEDWMVVRVPEEVRRWFKGYHYCEDNGLHHFMPRINDEVGVICGVGDTISEAIDALKENFEAMKDEPVSIEVAGFADLLKEIDAAEKQGVEFTDQIVPDPASVL